MQTANADGQATFRGMDEVALSTCAARLAVAAAGGGVIYLEGELGAGKTTFARALLHAMGCAERIKSPTYSLIESYRVGDVIAHHLDLYRIADAGELEWLGLTDLFETGALLLIEWPERARNALPPADLTVQFRHAGRLRDLSLVACGARGGPLLEALRGTESSQLAAFPVTDVEKYRPCDGFSKEKP
ncbi:MAG: tRNA (adenosine(37)-N6)-threonylcarbamoyltransferase complex ATPase subunit type 1 TsaE [Rhodanobacteraceae bacterium]